MPLKPDLSELTWIGIFSGLLSGFVLGILLCFWNVPLILEAEKFEVQNPSIIESRTHSHSHGNATHSHSQSTSSENPKQPEDLLQRNLWTLLGTSLLGLAFGILSSLWMYFLSPKEFSDLSSSFKTSLYAFSFGLSGFLIFFAIPAFGLPPELPGRAAAASDFETRQTWWYLCVGSSFAGFLAFSVVLSHLKFGNYKRWILGIGVLFGFIAIPFLYGVPQLEEYSLSPESLRKKFELISWITNFLFWILLSFSFLFLLRKKIRSSLLPEKI